MRIFKSRISEVCDIFLKLSGLNSLTATNLRKKTDNGLISLKEIGLIGESIKAKDIIYFDLSFYETWLDIEMTLECGNRSYKMKFELKVIRNCIKSDFENILINLGIKSWANFVANNYYAVTELIVDYPDISSGFNNSILIPPRKQSDDISFMNNFTSSDSVVSFDYDSKLTCKLIFTDMFQVVYDMLAKSNIITTQNCTVLPFDFETQRIKQLKAYFNDIFLGWILSKCDYIAIYNNIVWRFQPQTDQLPFDADETSIDSSSLNISFNSNKDIRKKSTNLYQFDKRINYGNTTSKEADGFRIKSFQKKRSSSTINQLYKKDIHFLKNTIDYFAIINKCVLLYIPIKEFENKSPDTKNLVELSNGIVESFEIELKDNLTVSYKDDVWLVQKQKWFKSWIAIICLIAVIIILGYAILRHV